MIITFIGLSVFAFLFGRIIDADEDKKKTIKFWVVTGVLGLCIWGTTWMPYHMVVAERKTGNNHIKWQITEELGKNLEVAYKWKASLEKGFAWMESFSREMYDRNVIYQIHDSDLLKRISEAYAKLKEVDSRLENFRTGIGFKMRDEVPRVNSNLDDLIVKLKAALVALEMKGFKRKDVNIKVDEAPSTEEVIIRFKGQFMSQTVSADSASVVGG